MKAKLLQRPNKELDSHDEGSHRRAGHRVGIDQGGLDGRLEVDADQVRPGEVAAVQAVHLALGDRGHSQRARHRQKANLSARMTRISVTNGCYQTSPDLFEWPIDLDLTRYTTQT